MSTALDDSAALLDRLCEACGIAAEYTDIWGARHTAPAHTKRALLAAMGVAGGGDEDLESALSRHRRRAWQRLLPAAQVSIAADDGVPVTVTIADARAGRGYAWRLAEENGRQHRGVLDVADLEPSARARIDGQSFCRYTVRLPVSPANGYHRLAVIEGAEPPPLDARGGGALIVAPPTCYRPEWLADGRRVFGVAAQLYGVTSQRNWGIGDFTDLSALVETAARRGADVVGVNPLHSLFPQTPSRVSPYSPSSRLFLNVLYLDVEAIAEAGECAAARELIGSAGFQERLAALRASPRVDYEGVAACKLEVLEVLYACFRDTHLAPESDRGRAFRAFQSRGGEALQRHALYEALQEHFQRDDASVWGWPVWPEIYREPGSPAVEEFAAEHRERVEYFQYLQWQAQHQLESAARRADACGLALGLYVDLALGVDRAGAETWTHRASFALDASIGAPPDDYSPEGQNWGLPPFDPNGLREAEYAPFVAALRESMQCGGALRIDHVMGLMRLFWIPDNASAADGAYVHYPFDDLLGIVALESQRNRCVVVGEDLGTVPDAVREACRRRAILSYRLLLFERDEAGDFLPPAAYPAEALTSIATHDLPTLKGFWEGRDLGVRHALGLIGSEEAREEQLLARAQDRIRLQLALDREGLLPEGVRSDAASAAELDAPLARAAHRFLARTPAAIMMIQLEDALGEAEQANLPGTVDEHPNWRRKLRLRIDEWSDAPEVAALMDAVRAERGPRPGRAPGRAAPPRAGAVIPSATYRLQLGPEFTLHQAAETVSYLNALGISHCYLSPILAARPGSSHGYDVVDHGTLNPELGGADGFEALTDALRANGMGQILDIVPNHMGVMGSDNAWWLDVLEHGPASAYAAYFDIDWRPAKEALRGKVLLPVLGRHYGAALAGGELAIEFSVDSGAFAVTYHEHRFPLDPRTYPGILAHRPEAIDARLGADHPAAMELRSLVTAFGRLPDRADTAPDVRMERSREATLAKQRLSSLCRETPLVAELIAENVAAIEASASVEEGPDWLHHLLEQQAFRLAYWQVAADDINYRRFFDINTLAGLRVEQPEVFADTHRLIIDLVRDGKVEGLRIDHPDGLYDPAAYLEALNGALAGGEADADSGPPHYLVVEKILAAYEHLPETWPVHGTTGYDFAALVNGLGVVPESESAMDGLYRQLAGGQRDFDELLYRCKKLIIRTQLSSELAVLANSLDNIAQLDPYTRDFTLNALRDALVETVACFPVYRTYVAQSEVSAEDRRYVEWAIAQARRRAQAADVTVFDFVEDVLLQRVPAHRGVSLRDECLHFTMRFQQYTSPVMAKGLEDTAFYVYNRLVSLNDVGGDPRRYATSVSAFHQENRERLRRWPHAMLATSTHDGKRSEDVRARINVLTEMPERWRERVRRWRRINRRRRTSVDDHPAPSANDEYLLYQTLLGAWPLEPVDAEGLEALRARMEAYMLKAAREAKVHTSWINPHTEYEQSLQAFVSALLASPDDNIFLADFAPFAREIARYGLLSSLSQTLLKLTCPGVPDIYQGNELWTFRLVDPDNRGAVDYARRSDALERLQRPLGEGETPRARARELMDNLEDGRVKLYVTWKALELRRARCALFERGEYIPLEAYGERSMHLCAFARRLDGSAVVVAAPRWFAALAARDDGSPTGAHAWQGTRIESPPLEHVAYRNVLTDERIPVRRDDDGAYLDAAELFESFSVALLVEEPPL